MHWVPRNDEVGKLPGSCYNWHYLCGSSGSGGAYPKASDSEFLNKIPLAFRLCAVWDLGAVRYTSEGSLGYEVESWLARSPAWIPSKPLHRRSVAARCGLLLSASGSRPQGQRID